MTVVFFAALPRRATSKSMLAVRPILCSARRPPPVAARVVVATPPRPLQARSSCGRTGDDLELDRRGGPRQPDLPLQHDRFTAATHRPLPLVFALGHAGRWALVKGLSLGPHGVLVHLVDATDPELDPRDRVGAAVWMRLARLAHPVRPPSPLWLSSSCVNAPKLVAELARAGVARQPRSVELVALSWHGDPLTAPRELPRLSCVGEIAPLGDPHPTVLAIALPEATLEHLARLARACERPNAMHATLPGDLAATPQHGHAHAGAVAAEPGPATAGPAPSARRARKGRPRGRPPTGDA